MGDMSQSDLKRLRCQAERELSLEEDKLRKTKPPIFSLGVIFLTAILLLFNAYVFVMVKSHGVIIVVAGIAASFMLPLTIHLNSKKYLKEKTKYEEAVRAFYRKRHEIYRELDELERKVQPPDIIW